MMGVGIPTQTIMNPAAKALFWLLCIALWIMVNLAVSVGLFTVLFVMFANADFERFFVEIGNLASHYLAAPAAARLDFEQLVGVVFAGLFILVCLCRLSALRRGLLTVEKAVTHG